MAFCKYVYIYVCKNIRNGHVLIELEQETRIKQDAESCMYVMENLVTKMPV